VEPQKGLLLLTSQLWHTKTAAPFRTGGLITSDPLKSDPLGQDVLNTGHARILATVF